MANEFLDNAFQKGMAGTTAGGHVAGPWGALFGASAGVLTAAAQEIMKMGDKWEADTLQQQQILNNMVEDGYEIGSNLPKHLKWPSGAKRSTGIEGSQNPKPKIWFDRKSGKPELDLDFNKRTAPEGMENVASERTPRKGGLGTDADINPQGLKEINARYYSGQKGFDAYDIAYPNVPRKTTTEPGQVNGSGSYASPSDEKNTNLKPIENFPKYDAATNTTTGPNNQNEYSQNSGPNVPEGSYWNGKKEFNEQIPRYTPFEQQYRHKNIQNLMENRGDFGPIQNEELRRFKEETAPQLAEQYFGRNPSSFGSAYPESLGRGGAQLGSRLAAMKAQYEADRESRQMAFAKEPTFDTYKHPKEPGIVDKLTENFDSKPLVEGIQKAGQWIKGQWNKPQEQQEPTQQPITANGKVYQPEELSQLSNDLKNPNGVQDLFKKKFQQELEQKNFKAGGRGY